MNDLESSKKGNAMNTVNPPLGATGCLWRIAVVALAYFAGSHLSGALVDAAGLRWPDTPWHTSQAARVVLDLVSSVLLAACLVPVAAGIRGSIVHRWLILASFFYVSYGINNQLEGATYSTIGGAVTMILFYVIPCLLAAGVAARVVPAPDPALPLTTVFTDRTWTSWWWRLLLAWVSFPVIFFVFGALAFPLVSETYQQPESALVVPGPGTVLRTVFIRSLLFLVVTAPVIIAWVRSRRGLVITLGCAFFIMVGVVGLVGAHWLPIAMRTVHAVEILADSFIYAWVIAILLVPTGRQTAAASSTAEVTR